MISLYNAYAYVLFGFLRGRFPRTPPPIRREILFGLNKGTQEEKGQ